MQQQPSSPGTCPVDLEDCLQELLKFTLQSRINGTLEHDLGLSKDFCSNLISNNLPQANSDSADSYKNLAPALWKSISGASLLEDRNELIIREGAELVNILKTVEFELHVQEPFFTQLKDGRKTVEGRCAAGDYNRIQPGALILFNKCVLFEVKDIRRYPTFSAMLEAESLVKVLPEVKTIPEGVEVYRKFYNEEKELSNGVLAIHVEKSVSQPYIILCRILSGLDHKGIRSILSL